MYFQSSGMVFSILQWCRWIYPTFWRFFLSFFMKNEKETLFQPSGMVSSILQWCRWFYPTFWRFFLSFFMKNEKEILIRCISYYLNDPQMRFFCKFHLFWLLLPQSSFLVKQFSNFKESDELGVYALTDCHATDITFHRSYRGCLY